MKRRTPRPAGTRGAAETIELPLNSSPAPLPDLPPAVPRSAVPRRWLEDLAQIAHKLTWDLREISLLTGLSRRLLERELAAGRFPRPDLRVGRRCLWFQTSVRRYLGLEA
jgi:hypothetical protein